MCSSSYGLLYPMQTPVFVTCTELGYLPSESAFLCLLIILLQLTPESEEVTPAHYTIMVSQIVFSNKQILR